MMCDVRRLLSQIVYRPHYDGLEGLSPIQALLRTDDNGSIVQFLTAQLPTLPEKIRGGIAFALAERFRQTGDLQALRALFAREDAEVQQSVLNGLWGEPDAHAEMGPGIVALAMEGMRHPDPQVRASAASVVQNQSAWGVSVIEALSLLLRLLDDPSPRVRQQAAYAVGNVAKRKYDLSAHRHVLSANLSHEDSYVRKASAWALWQFSQRHYDIAPAVGDLVRLLASTEDYAEPRKMAAGALLHHARKSARNRDTLQRQIEATLLDTRYKEVTRFLQQLAEQK